MKKIRLIKIFYGTFFYAHALQIQSKESSEILCVRIRQQYKENEIKMLHASVTLVVTFYLVLLSSCEGKKLAISFFKHVIESNAFWQYKTTTIFCHFIFLPLQFCMFSSLTSISLQFTRGFFCSLIIDDRFVSLPVIFATNAVLFCKF